MINASDLRKGNWVRTEFGICRVAYVIWNDIYVYGKDNRVNYAREVEGLGIGEIDTDKIKETFKNRKDLIKNVLKKWLFIHEMQNYYYWNNRKELKIEL